MRSVSLAFAALLAGALPVLAEPSPDIAARMDAVIDRAIAEDRIVGAVVLVSVDGKVVYHRAAGMADREAGTPMGEDAIFRLASVTKPMVSAAFMRLVEDGRVGLDDPVTKYLPDFAPRLPDGTAPTITLEQLLTHTSGLSYRFIEPMDSDYDRLDVSDGLDQPGLSLDENLRRLAQAPLKFRPGEGWGYSLGIDVLGGVMEQVTGQPLSDAVENAVTGPLGMTDTGFTVTDPARLAVPYADGDPVPARMTDGQFVPLGNKGALFAPARALDATSYPSGGGGMVGTAGDFMTFLEAIRAGGGGILKAATVTAMTHDTVGAQAATQGQGWGFGYGWAVLDDPAAAGTPQSGGTLQWGGAYGHSWFVDPARKMSVVAFTNTTFEGMSGPFTTEVRDAAYPPAE